MAKTRSRYVAPAILSLSGRIGRGLIQLPCMNGSGAQDACADGTHPGGECNTGTIGDLSVCVSGPGLTPTPCATGPGGDEEGCVSGPGGFVM
jgi:hypothetical protein